MRKGRTEVKKAHTVQQTGETLRVILYVWKLCSRVFKPTAQYNNMFYVHVCWNGSKMQFSAWTLTTAAIYKTFTQHSQFHRENFSEIHGKNSHFIRFNDKIWLLIVQMFLDKNRMRAVRTFEYWTPKLKKKNIKTHLENFPMSNLLYRI